MRSIRYCLVAAIATFNVARVQAEGPSARALLDKYKATVERISTVHIEATLHDRALGVPVGGKVDDPKEDRRNPRTVQLVIFRQGDRSRVSINNPPTFDDLGNPRGHKAITDFLHGGFLGIDQTVRVHWRGRIDNPDVQSSLTLDLRGPSKHDPFPGAWAVSLVFGHTHLLENDPLWTIMTDAPSLEVSPRQETLAEHSTFVVTSRGKFGKHTIWLDPACGCLPRKLEIEKQAGDLFFSHQLGVEQTSTISPQRQTTQAPPPGLTYVSIRNRVDNVQIEEIEGQFVITAYDEVTERATKRGDKADRLEVRSDYRTRLVDGDSTKWPANAFQPTVTVPNGTPITAPDRPGQPYTWQNGRVE